MRVLKAIAAALNVSAESLLVQAGLLEREQRGKWAYFSIRTEAAARLADLVRLTEVTT